ncbi:PAS domain S-box protein [Burkholderia sp. LMU1-1-1.1]|uniref:sensor histidine kinase n=1 Tax=Burkholderia sp. LMU1-1-1.1 TaxID=3135266 RepID=UPI00342E9F0B
MNKRQRPELDPDRLRYVAEQAVAALAKTGRPPPADADTETLKRWHELQVSQIELDMQSVALAEVQTERDLAEAAREHYAALYDQAPAGYLSLDPDGRITRANHAAADLLGCRREELPGRSFEQFVAPQSQAGLRRFLAELLVSGQRGVLEVPLFAALRQVRIEANLDVAARKCRMILTDIGSAGVREAARRRALQVIDSMGEGVMVCDVEKRIVSVNPAFTALTGYPVEEALGRDPRFLGRPGAHPLGFHAEAMRCLCSYGRWQGEVFNRRRDGVPYVAAMSLTVIRDESGAITHFIGVFSDITARQRADADLLKLSRELDGRVAARTAELTEANRLLMLEVAERKRAQAALQESRDQLRKLAEHLETVKEDERKRIARDIHDELGQNLLALRIDISMLSARTGERHARLHQRVNGVLENIDTTIRNVRGIMNELRPAVLDLGLPAAMEWQAAEFRKRSGMTCALTLPDEATLATIASDMAIVLFRGMQEALSNVRRHAHASHVDIVLAVRGARLVFSVADNGIGIAPHQRDKSESFGLIGMAQRVAALGGSFEIGRYVPGDGCTLTLGFDLRDDQGAD